MSRALAHRLKKVERFSDPTALTLLPQEERDRVSKFRDEPPKRFRERATYGYLVGQAAMMVARTLEIDDAIRSAHAPHVVILGAGLDGRASCTSRAPRSSRRSPSCSAARRLEAA